MIKGVIFNMDGVLVNTGSMKYIDSSLRESLNLSLESAISSKNAGQED